MTTRVMPPGDGSRNTVSANGRVYTQTPGNTLDVPDFDAAILVANGWVQSAVGGTVGATAQRPASPLPNQHYVDTTVGALVIFDAKAKLWRHHVTGAAV